MKQETNLTKTYLSLVVDKFVLFEQESQDNCSGYVTVLESILMKQETNLTKTYLSLVVDKFVLFEQESQDNCSRYVRALDPISIISDKQRKKYEEKQL